MTATDDGVFVFTRPDGHRIRDNGKCFRGNTSEIERLNTEHGVEIDATTSKCRWTGESMDYSQAIEWMQLRDAAALNDSRSTDSRASTRASRACPA